MRALFAWTAGALGAWAAFAQWLAPPAPAIPLAPLQNAIVAERLAAGGAEVMVLGSSLTARLPVGTLDTNATAVGISAGSAADAVALAQRLHRRPRVAVIEENRLTLAPREGDMSALADSARARPRWRVRRTEYLPSTQAIALIVRASDAIRTLALSVRAKREQEVRYLGSDAMVDRAAAAQALAWTRAALETWRAAGTTVYLVRLPTAAPASFEATTRALVAQAFPDSLFPRVRFDDQPWPTTDGQHLESAAARRAARQILREVRARSGIQP